MFERWLVFLTLSVLLACGLAFAEDDHEHEHFSLPEKEVKQRFKENEIDPDVIDTAPGKVLFVEWETGKEANLKDELTPRDVAKEPKFTWETAEAHKFYTIALVDPDEFNRKEHTEREFLHYLCVNIPGKDVKECEVLAEYVGSGPPKDGGLHRYVFLLYEQPEKLVFDERKLKFPSPTGIKDRVKFSIRKFAKKYKLENPVAGNFYFAKWDETVPALLKKLGG